MAARNSRHFEEPGPSKRSKSAITASSTKGYGPQTELDEFKALCIVETQSDDGNETTKELDFSGVVPLPEEPEHARRVNNAWDDTWNFRDEAQEVLGFYWFAFDMRSTFPTKLFERLARMFPSLAFDCDCIGSMDEFMAFGWFNGPLGSESFDFYDVPEDYWTTRLTKRDPLPNLLHQRRVAKLKEKAWRLSGN